MHGKNSKLVSTTLSALLFTQGLLGFAAVTLVVMKDRTHAGPAERPAIVAAVAVADHQVR